MAFDFLKKTSAENSPTIRKLRGVGIQQGTAAADDFEVVLTGVHEGVVRFLKAEVGIELGSVDQGKVRKILRDNLDPKSAHSIEERKRKEQRVLEIRQELQAALAGFAPVAPAAPAIDIVALASLMATTVANAVAAAMKQNASTNPPAPATTTTTTPPVTNPPAPAPADEVITFDTSTI